MKMKNLADVIENFIMAELLREQEDALMVQRNELAERLSCAPSQISYVLSTRFTPERGFLVQSRRGSGGFVRIVRMEPEGGEPRREPSAEEVVERLEEQKIISGREGALLRYMLRIIDVKDKKKKAILQQALDELASAGRR